MRGKVERMSFTDLMNPFIYVSSPLPNMYVTAMNGRTICMQSYNTVVAIVKDNTVYLRKYNWEMSRTTIKHVRKFLAEPSVKAIRKGIKEGKYKEVE